MPFGSERGGPEERASGALASKHECITSETRAGCTYIQDRLAVTRNPVRTPYSVCSVCVLGVLVKRLVDAASDSTSTRCAAGGRLPAPPTRRAVHSRRRRWLDAERMPFPPSGVGVRGARIARSSERGRGAGGGGDRAHDGTTRTTTCRACSMHGEGMGVVRARLGSV